MNRSFDAGVYKVLIYPFREGDPLPNVEWNEDRTRLKIYIGSSSYEYVFGKADNGRTVFTMEVDSRKVAGVEGRPARPELKDMPPVHTPSRYDRNGPELGPPPQHPDPAPVPVKVFTENAQLVFASSGPGQEVRYTLDASSPAKEGLLYAGPVTITHSCTVKAVTHSRGWAFGPEADSEEVTARFERQEPQPAATPKAAQAQGLICRIYEVFVPEWDTEGLVNPTLNYLPNLDNYAPILTVASSGFELPAVQPQKPIEESYKGYYRFTGYINVEKTGVYTFDILSNGPLRLRVGNRTVIEETGYYHQDNKNRYGQVALAAGLQPVELVVCDPIFWKKERDGDMPFAVQCSVEGAPMTADIATMADQAELAAHAKNPFAKKAAEIPLLKAQKPSGKLVHGLVRETYARTELAPASGGWLFTQKAGPAGLFDVAKQKPVYSELADEEITGSDYDGQLYAYTGWYKAPYDGVYTFVLDGKGNNRLALNGQVVAQNNVPGEQADGRIRLETGYHQLAIMMARSAGRVSVQTPADTEPMKLTFGDLYRPENPALADDPANFLVLDLPMDADRKEEQEIKTRMGDYKLRVEGAGVVDDEQMGQALEFTGKGSGLRLYDWPCVGRYITMSFWIKLPPKSPRKEFLQIGREGATGQIDSRSVNIGYPRFYKTGNTARTKELEEGKWVHLTMQWGPWTRIFVNGELKGKAFAAGDPSMGWRSVNLNARSDQMQLFVGRNGSFKGRIAGLKVYNTLLGDDCVEQMYQQAKKPCVN